MTGEPTTTTSSTQQDTAAKIETAPGHRLSITSDWCSCGHRVSDHDGDDDEGTWWCDWPLCGCESDEETNDDAE